MVSLPCYADQASLQDSDDPAQQPSVADLLVLDHLAASWGCAGSGSDGSSSSNALASARRFMCCRMLHDALLAVKEGGQELDPKLVTLLLVQHRKLQDSSLPVLGECSWLLCFYVEVPCSSNEQILSKPATNVWFAAGLLHQPYWQVMTSACWTSHRTRLQ